MSVLNSLGGSLSGFKSGFVNATAYAWVLYALVGIAVLVFGAYMFKIFRDKKKQWTHTLKIKRVLVDGKLSPEIKIKMRRFPLIKTSSVFELEKPFLGSYLITELDSYTGYNEFSVIVNKDNRIYINTGERFDPESSSILISGKHAGIDLAFEDLKADWQNINKVSKRIEWSQIAKFAMLGLLIIAVMVVSIKGISQWGENHKADAQKKIAEAEAMSNLAEALKTSEATANTQVLILDLLKELYQTENIRTIVKEKTNVTIS